MITGKQVVALSELLHACRPDWDTRGIQAALRRVDTTWAWPAVCLHAITVAANAGNQTPDAIAWQKTASSAAPVDHGQPCPRHNGTIRRNDGRYHCCWLAEKTPVEPYAHTPHPPPAGLRERVAAALNAPAYDRLPPRETPATPVRATNQSEGATP